MIILVKKLFFGNSRMNFNNTYLVSNDSEPFFHWLCIRKLVYKELMVLEMSCDQYHHKLVPREILDQCSIHLQRVPLQFL
jgi:hypothetical protein